MLYFIAISHHIAVIVDTVLFQKDILSILVSSGMHVYSGPPPNHQCPLKPLRLQVQLGPWVSSWLWRWITSGQEILDGSSVYPLRWRNLWLQCFVHIHSIGQAIKDQYRLHLTLCCKTNVMPSNLIEIVMELYCIHYTGFHVGSAKLLFEALAALDANDVGVQCPCLGWTNMD